jgi:hypothetical protein
VFVPERVFDGVNVGVTDGVTDDVELNEEPVDGVPV